MNVDIIIPLHFRPSQVCNVPGGSSHTEFFYKISVHSVWELKRQPIRSESVMTFFIGITYFDSKFFQLSLIIL